jgi:YggT family protein
VFFSFKGGNPLYILGEIYVLILFARAILSWFPMSYDSPFNSVRHFIFTITEPWLAPFRRLIPPVGMLDISFIVAFIVLQLIVQNVLGRLPI